MMSAQRENPQTSGASHASAWITVIVAVPLLYLLTLPAVVAAVVPIGSPAAPDRSHWLYTYAVPAVWLSEMDVFSKLYNPYCEWCWKAVLKRTDTL